MVDVSRFYLLLRAKKIKISLIMSIAEHSENSGAEEI
jgi:hypothetical protein